MSTPEETVQLQRALERERAARVICAELNGFVDLEQTLKSVLKHVQQLSGCEATAIRLHDDGDYPYYVYEGFPESFILKENSLCARGESGQRIPGSDGEGFLLECMCGNIIRGRFDPALNFFSEKGSFWSNNTSALLDDTTEEERQSHTRNYCNSCGYESMALVPIICRGERVGLIQLNDKRTDRFTEDLILFVETLGEQIGLAVRNSLTHTRLKEALEEVRVLKGILPICSACKKIRDDKGYWHQVETYIRDRSDAEFSHSVCPECLKKLYPEFSERDD